MKPIAYLCLIFTATSSFASELKPFKATYQITRGGDPTGQQTTILSKTGENQWTLKDTIIGTNGLASFVGFKRTESTQFRYTQNGLVAIKHDMQQKAAFSKRKYHFELNPNNQYSVNVKNQNTLIAQQESPVISSQLLPIAIALAACNEASHINLTVLKNKTASPYQFTVSAQELLQATRIYPQNIDKQTISWLDSTKQCLPIKNRHEVQNEPTIETNLTGFKWL